MKKLLYYVTFLSSLSTLFFACDRDKRITEQPNILWITIEDMSPYGFGCYGNKHIKTPIIDSLAKAGILFTKAYSTAPHCSPARSTLITGAPATTFGMDVHREKYETSPDIFYPYYLRQAGYFCTNQDKTDYNSTVDHIAMWDECSKEASYASPKREPGQPFFSIFNTTATHMGRICSITTRGRRDLKNFGIDPDSLPLPSYLPDLPDVRSDFAYHLESAEGADQWVGAFLEDLDRRGLKENTIIFFFSDHGGCLPRGKGYPYESGLRIPLVVYVPEKWREKFQLEKGLKDDRLIGFEDFAPTLLQLAGADIPVHMQGKPFLGNDLSEKNYQFGFRTNQENYHFDPSRTVTDGKYKYIRNYIPHKPFCLRNLYQWGMPANQAWDELILSGADLDSTLLLPFKPKEVEMLFDLEKDPDELYNLAGLAQHQSKLEELRKAVSGHIRESKDLGFFPRAMRKKEGGLNQWIKDVNFPMEEMYKAVEVASMPSENDIPYLEELLSHSFGELRYWGAVGILNLSRTGIIKEPSELMTGALHDKEAEVQSLMAEAFVYLGQEEKGLSVLYNLFVQNDNAAYSSLETITWTDKKECFAVGYRQKLLELLAKHEFESGDRMSVYLKIRSLLVNIGELSIYDLYPESYKKKELYRNLEPRMFKYPIN